MEFIIEKDVIGLVTFILSLVGLTGTLALWWFIRLSRHELGKSMANVYFWDGVRFLFTMGFWLAGWIEAPEWFWNTLYFGRPFVLAFAIFALWRLYRHFRRIGKGL